MTQYWLNWGGGSWHVPDHTKQALEDYILRGYTPGSFLTAVLRNDFVNAVCRADHINAEHLKDIAKWIVNHAPAGCWGGDRAIAEWLDDTDGIRSEYYKHHEQKRMWEILKETENG